MKNKKADVTERPEGPSTTSAYFLMSLPAWPVCSLSSRPTILIQLLFEIRLFEVASVPQGTEIDCIAQYRENNGVKNRRRCQGVGWANRSATCCHMGSIHS
jgi:hypothetical protein